METLNSRVRGIKREYMQTLYQALYRKNSNYTVDINNL